MSDHGSTGSGQAAAQNRTRLDPDKKSPRAQEFELKLGGLVVGQERAVRRISSLYQIYLAGMQNPGRPLGTTILLGPTGSGKTRVVEAAAEVLFNDSNAMVKVDCAEFQHSHEIAKLIGSPPGYLGHRETAPMMTQENLDKYHNDRDKLSFILFDEIEKASDSLWQLLLGVLDKASLTLGDNRKVDFSRCMIFLTSNLGAKEMSELITGSIGFAPARSRTGTDHDDVDQKIYRTASEAAKRKFSPEFMNRIDKVVVFRSLKEHHLKQILELELAEVQSRIMKGSGEKFVFTCTEPTKNFLLNEGYDLKYGARHLKRAIERFLVYPISNLVATDQVATGDLVLIDFDEDSGKLIFAKEEGGALIAVAEAQDAAYQAKYATIAPQITVSPERNKFEYAGHSTPTYRWNDMSREEKNIVGGLMTGGYIKIGKYFYRKEASLDLELLP